MKGGNGGPSALNQSLASPYDKIVHSSKQGSNQPVNTSEGHHFDFTSCSYSTCNSRWARKNRTQSTQKVGNALVRHELSGCCLLERLWGSWWVGRHTSLRFGQWEAAEDGFWDWIRDDTSTLLIQTCNWDKWDWFYWNRLGHSECWLCREPALSLVEVS